MPSDWLFTKGGQEFAHSIRRIGEALTKLGDMPREERVADLAETLFAQALEHTDAIPTFDGAEPAPEINERQVSYYAARALQAAEIFVQELEKHRAQAKAR